MGVGVHVFARWRDGERSARAKPLAKVLGERCTIDAGPELLPCLRFGIRTNAAVQGDRQESPASQLEVVVGAEVYKLVEERGVQGVLADCPRLLCVVHAVESREGEVCPIPRVSRPLKHGHLRQLGKTLGPDCRKMSATKGE